MTNKIVSIITPSFNRADIIAETAASIFSQTYPFWEWVIVDDGSTDESWEVLQGFKAKDNRVKIFRRNREPKGACVCRNIAVENCSGEYLIFLDTDDVLASFCLEQRVNAMEQNPECDFIIFPMLLFKNRPDDLRKLWNSENGEDDLARIFQRDPICQGTGTLWKKESFIRIGMWDEELLLWQDVDLHLRAFSQGYKYKKYLHLKPDVFLRISEVSLSRTGYFAPGKTFSRIHVLAKALKNIPVSKRKHLKKSIQSMYFDIFFGCIRSRQFTLLRKLKDLAREYHLLDLNRQTALFCIEMAYRLRFVKIKFIENNVHQYFKPDSEHNIGRYDYDKVIEI